MMGISLGSALAYLIGGQLLEPLLAQPPIEIQSSVSSSDLAAAFLVMVCQACCWRR